MQHLLDTYERMRELEGGNEGVSPNMVRQLREAIGLLRDGPRGPPGDSDGLHLLGSDSQDATQLQLVALHQQLLHIETAIHSNLQSTFRLKLARDRRRLLGGAAETGTEGEAPLGAFRAKLEQLGYAAIAQRYLCEEALAEPAADAAIEPLQQSRAVTQERDPIDTDGIFEDRPLEISSEPVTIDRAVLLEDEATMEQIMDDLEWILPNCSISGPEAAFFGSSEDVNGPAQASRISSLLSLFGFGTSAIMQARELPSCDDLASEPWVSEHARQTETVLMQHDVFHNLSLLLRQIIFTLGEMHDESAEFALTKAGIEQDIAQLLCPGLPMAAPEPQARQALSGYCPMAGAQPQEPDSASRLLDSAAGVLGRVRNSISFTLPGWSRSAAEADDGAIADAEPQEPDTASGLLDSATDVAGRMRNSVSLTLPGWSRSAAEAEDAVAIVAEAGGTAGGSHENTVVAVRRPCQLRSSSEPFAWPLCSALDRNSSTVQTIACTSAIFLAAVVNYARQGTHHVADHGISSSHCVVDCLIDLVTPADYFRLHSILKRANGHVHHSLKATNSYAETRTETACRFVTESVVEPLVGGLLIRGGIRAACVAGDIVWCAAQSGTGAVRKLTGEEFEVAEESPSDSVAEAEQEGAKGGGEDGGSVPFDHCCVCLERAAQGQLCVWNPCGHTICKECGDSVVARAVAAHRSPACPTCRRTCLGLIRIFPS